jgi:ABC-type polar amino acid transport system ATPase subunit
VIRVEDLWKRYGAGADVLRGVGLTVDNGRLVCLLGTSGSGKSTLLRCLVGLETFQRGRIQVGELVAEGGAERSPLLGRVGMVFQSLELFPHLSALDNCTLGPVRARRRPRAEAEARARELLGRLGLGDKQAAYPAQLSGGQRQRVAIARALAMEPEVLVYDEPTSALDPSLKREVLEAIEEVRTTGVTQVVVTHDMALARNVADEVLILDGGVIAERGAPAAVFANPASDATRRLLEHA